MSAQQDPQNRSASAETLEIPDLEIGVYDQTLFAEDVLFTDMDSRSEEPIVVQSSSRKKMFLLVLLGFFAFAIFAGSLYLQMRRNQAQELLIEQETRQVQQAQGIPALERQLSLLRNDIETADPLESPLAFPPLDFRLNLQDATAILLQQNR
jgi:hypothetical protein